jgi:general secretion pathway protein H
MQKGSFLKRQIPTSNIQSSSENGFTLIEMMIVLAIIAGLVALAMPYIGSRNSQTKKFLREFTVLSRELHTKAKLQGAVYRLVINMEGMDPNIKKEQTYWVEKGKSNSVMKPNEEEDALQKAKEAEGDKQGDTRGFEVDTATIKEPRKLPSGIVFDKVELARSPNPITQGKAYIHYMPQGLVDEAAIHIKGEKTQAWTISIHPLTGRAELISKPISLKEMKSE